MEYVDITRHVIALAAAIMMFRSIKKYTTIKGNEYERKKYAQLSFVYGTLVFCLVVSKVTIFIAVD